jgi:hypothetical protein
VEKGKPMTRSATRRVGIVYWRADDGIAPLIAQIVEGLGHEAVGLSHQDRLPKELDMLLAYGPLGSLVPLANQLRALPPSQRPAFGLWMTEQLSNPALPEWMHHPLSGLRSNMERLAFRETEPGIWRPAPSLSWLGNKANRLRYYGDLHWMCRENILSVLAVGSKWIATFLRARGFSPIVAYIGSHPDWWAPMSVDRDIPVLWLGKMATTRRRRRLARVRSELRSRGVDMLVVDGEENPYVFGEERTVLLNRTKIVLNILREKWDNHSLRFFLAAPNRALVVTEPTLDHTPFTPGVHCVAAPTEQMADTICHYLSHADGRNRIVEQAYQLATEDLTMKKSVEQILEQLREAS